MKNLLRCILVIIIAAAAPACGGEYSVEGGDGDQDADGADGHDAAQDGDAPLDDGPWDAPPDETPADGPDIHDVVADISIPDADIPIPNHTYPKINFMTWGGASAAWYEQFDWVINPGTSPSSATLAAREANPELRISATKDFNACNVGDGECPEEWRAPAAGGGWVRIYGDRWYLGNLTETCGLYEGKTYREWIVQDYTMGMDWDNLDGWNTDGLWQTVCWNSPAPDFDGDGECTGDDQDLWADGVISLFREIRAVLPDKLITVNPGKPAAFYDQGPDYLNGVMSEKFMVFVGWDEFLRNYRLYAENAVHPHMVYIDNHFQGDPDPGARSKNNFRFMRFGLAATLLYDGYYSYKDGIGDGYEAVTNEHYFNRYYDEYDVPLTQPLGPAVSIKETAEGDDDDVYCRFFEGGAMILNGGRQDTTVTEEDLRAGAAELGMDWDTIAGVDGHYYRFAGQQYPELNDGGLFEEIVLPSKETWAGCCGATRKGDGILLVREPGKVVAAPVYIDTEDSVTSPGAESAVLDGFRQSCDYAGSGFRTGGAHCNDTTHPYRGHSRAAADSGAAATFQVTLVNEGIYKVYEYHPEVDGYDVPHTIIHADGEETIDVDQRADAEQWNLMGGFRFTPGVPAQVIITADAQGAEVAADAIRFEWAGE
ncbi:MAG: putative glycoside hydrolase [Pseudomonadota bacterium]